jgi:hypothetical protein
MCTFSDVNVSHYVVAMAGEHFGLIGLPTVQHLLQLCIIIAVHPCVHIGGCIVLQAEEFLDGGDGFGAGHGLLCLCPPILQHGPRLCGGGVCHFANWPTAPGRVVRVYY